MSTKEKASETDEATEKGGGKKKLVLIALLVLLAAAGAAYFFLFSGSAEAGEEPVPGDVLKLDPIAVNLAGGGYLKIGVTLQFTEEGSGGGEGGGPDGSKATDLIISTFSQAQPADVTGAREALKEALEEKIVEAYEGDVMDIYYNEYVTQ
ncbi:MAG TPA: flagellar basal body-associated FliL family protein [Blastococcus sp.]|nr:flagellar basal body-associated FliL family protein [Blastococcus sp.]